MLAKLHHVTDETPGIRTYHFQSEDGLSFIAGQYVELTVEHSTPSQYSARRWFTLSSAPHDRLLSITTSHSALDSDFKKTLASLEPGEPVTLSMAQGDFVLPKDPRRRLIWVAGGLGITPFHSMIRQLQFDNEIRDLRLFYGVKTEEDIIFMDTFRAAGVQATIFVEEASAAWSGEHGGITAGQLVGLEKPDAETLIYIAGPEPMVEMLRLGLLQKSIRNDQIITDAFLGYMNI